MATFKYVLIPADDSQPLEERLLSYKKEDEVSCLTQTLQDYYRARPGQANAAAEQAKFRQQVEQEMAKQAERTGAPPPTLTDHMANMLSNMQTVDIVTLLNPTQRSDYEMVSMYVDDRGVAKQLPHNRRATELAAACGKSVDVRGDVFIARVHENEVQDRFERRDFALTDCSASAPWAVKAAAASKAQGAVSSSSGVPPCANSYYCSKTGTLRCTGCRLVYYCSAACQKEDWKKHKLSCAGRKK